MVKILYRYYKMTYEEYKRLMAACDHDLAHPNNAWARHEFWAEMGRRFGFDPATTGGMWGRSLSEFYARDVEHQIDE